MRKWKIHIPEGVQDYLPEECYAKRQMEQAIRALWRRSGYREIETPTFEYYDVFGTGIGAMDAEQVFKFFDDHGRILALRPDMTMPIARIVSTRMADAPTPLRLFYIGSAFGYDVSRSGQQREFSQAGIELLGAAGAAADAEVIASAIAAMRCAGLRDFQLDLGQVAFFKGLMEEAGLDEAQAEEVRALVEEKNQLGLELLLKQLSISGAVKARIMQLPMLYGGPEVLGEAQKLTRHPACIAAIDNLRAVYAILQDIGMAQYVSIDLGMLQRANYYSGVIFRGLSDRLGYPMLSGGRYDKLLGSFGRPMPATGFALGLKRLLIALERQGGLQAPPASNVLVGFAPQARAVAFAKMQAMRDAGLIVEQYLEEDEAGMRAYAQARGIARCMYFAADNTVRTYGEEEAE